MIRKRRSLERSTWHAAAAVAMATTLLSDAVINIVAVQHGRPTRVRSSGKSGGDGGVVVDFASSLALQWWVSHPSVGEASFDSATRVGAGRPVYSGAEPWTWPVNGVIDWGGPERPNEQVSESVN